ncbi:MAG: hypothetical protein P8O20_07495, partial [Bacteroidia bacterium]|nr:hypothetical protein [Bacteroidia bacterium]
MKYLFLIIFSISSICAKAQKHDYSQYPNVNMQRGMELYDEKKFNAAIAQFQLYLEQSPDSEITKSEAQYYLALSKLLAKNSDGEPSVLYFLDKNPGSHKTHMANLALGNHYYTQKKYSTARRYYKSVDKLAISKDDRTQYYYRFGYSQVVTKKYDRAYETLKPLIKISSEYKILATYYFGYCAYQKGNFEEAYRSFKSIEDNGPKDVKEYIAQIQYAQGEYTRCLATLERLSHRKNDALNL